VLSTTYPRATIQNVGGMGRESTIAVSTSTSITPVGLEPQGEGKVYIGLCSGEGAPTSVGA